jgi:hypothetical protein
LAITQRQLSRRSRALMAYKVLRHKI